MKTAQKIHVRLIDHWPIKIKMTETAQIDLWQTYVYISLNAFAKNVFAFEKLWNDELYFQKMNSLLN